jgi:hypothetical protein
MMFSSPASALTLHQHTNPDRNQDEGPETPDPVKVQRAQLVEQKQYAQAYQDESANRDLGTRRLLNRHFRR